MKNFCTTWVSVILAKKLCSEESVGVRGGKKWTTGTSHMNCSAQADRQTAAPCAQSCVCRIIPTDMASRGNSDAVSNKFHPHTSVHVTRSLQTKITSTITSHHMQAYKQSTGEISRYHSGAAKHFRHVTQCSWEILAPRTRRHMT